MHKVTHVEVLERYRLAVTFADGTSGVVDLSDLVGTGVFAAWTEYNEFRRVRIGDTGELVWSNDADLCPDWLYLQVTGKSPEELFPALAKEPANA